MQAPLDIVLRFTRELATGVDPVEILRHLGEVLVSEVGASAAIVLQLVSADEAQVVSARGGGLENLEGTRCTLGALGPELAEELLGPRAGSFRRPHAIPLVFEGDLFGVAFVLYAPQAPAPTVEQVQLAAALADVSAGALARAHRDRVLREKHRELVAIHQALARGEKLRALGEMAAGIVHDIGNILNPLRLQVGVLQRSQNPETIAQVVRNLESVIARGVGILERFRRFGREGPDVLEEVELGAIAQEVVMLLQSRIRASSARVEIQSTQPQRVRVSSSELASALVNLIVNSLDALPREGGWVVVRTGGGEGRAWIEVEDNGHGMSPEVQRRLFTVFFTTKGEAGTGLGLATVAAFVRRQGGTIDVRSAPGRGTCIKLSFPAASAEPIYASPQAPRPS